MTTWALWYSPDLEIQGNDAGDGASERDGSFTGQRFAQHLDATGSWAAVHDVDLRERNVWQLLVFPEKRRGRSKEADVKAVVPALAVQERDQLIEPSGPAAGSRKAKATGGAIQQVRIADQNPKIRASRDLLGHPDGGFFHARRPTIGTKQDTDAKSLAGKVKRGAFAVERILRETTEGGKSYEERSEFGVIDEFEMERLLFRRSIARDQKC